MSSGDFAAGLWAFITGGGVLILALAWSNWTTAAVIVLASIASMLRMPCQPVHQLAAHREGAR